MRYVKTVRLKHPVRPAQYFYSLHLVPFRRVTSNRINIEGIIYNMWSFPTIKKRSYLAAFPIENIDHFLLLEYFDTSQYMSLSTNKIYKLTDFNEEKKQIESVYTIFKKMIILNLIEEYEAGLINFEEFEKYIWGCGQRLINEVGIEKFVFYLNAGEGKFYEEK